MSRHENTQCIAFSSPHLEFKEACKHMANHQPFLFLDEGEAPLNVDPPKGSGMYFYSRSSGTSGRPKLIARTLESWTQSYQVHMAAFDLQACDHWLIPGHIIYSSNFYHTLLGHAYHKTVTNLPPKAIKSIKDHLVNKGVDALLTTPSLLFLILKQERTYPNLKRVVTVGERLPQPLLRKALEAFPHARCYHYYGAGELGQIAYTTYQDLQGSPNLLGKPFDKVNITIDADHNILVDSPFTACDYHPPATVYDKGELSHGLLYFLGRDDDQLNVYGKKISLQAIRNILDGLDGLYAYHLTRLTLDDKEAYDLKVIGTCDINHLKQALKPVLLPHNLSLKTQLYTLPSGKIDWTKY